MAALLPHARVPLPAASPGLRALSPAVRCSATGGARGGLKRRSCFRFRTDDDGVVDVVVVGKDGGYSIGVEVLFLPESGRRDGLVLRSLDTNEGLALAPDASGVLAAELALDAARSPFYLSFLLSDAAGAEIRTHRKTPFRVPVGIGRGRPAPLGLSISEDGVANFALFSKNAEIVVLCLYEGSGAETALEIELDRYVNRTSNVWHVSLESVDGYVSYGYRCGRFSTRHVLLDPYAKVIGDFISGNFVSGQGANVPSVKCLASLARVPSFDWGRDAHPFLPMEKLVVYRVNVASFTKHKSSRLPQNLAGTFSGLTGKIEHLRGLGVNAVLLEPVFPFDQLKGPYFPYHFFSPMNSYSYEGCSISAIQDMKEMIKRMHAEGMEVLLEVIFTQTSEGEAESEMISFRGIDSSSYYIGGFGSEASSALNCNHPVTQKLILDSLRHWVLDFHVDGFCFINASFLVRDPNSKNLSRPPLLESIAFDPVLSKMKIIADAWSPLDVTCMEIQFPHWKKWAEINARFSTDVRKFLKGEALISDLATRLCGSGDLFSSRGPAFSFNYVTRNSGLTLVDLVSFSSSELASELSWNCGEEGPSEDAMVLEKRLSQIRNFLFILFISLGVPVLNMGDECGLSAGGSPLYKDREPINWNGLKSPFAKEVTEFIAYLSALRSRRDDIFQRKEFLKVENICWYGTDQSEPQWEDPTCKFLSVNLKEEMDEKQPDLMKGDLFICFNANGEPANATLPALPEGSLWLRLVDTALPFPGFFASESDPSVQQAPGLSSYAIKAHSCVLFESKRALP